jgi:hypothetical protein
MANARQILVSSSMAVLVAAGSTGASAGAEPAASPQPVIRILAVVQDFDVPGHVLSQAKREVAEIYRLSGVTIVWDSTVGPEDTEEVLTQRLFVVLKPSNVRKDPATAALKPSVMGAAITSSAKRGRLAYIFYRRIQEFAGDTGATVAVVLGHAIAHEIGHLLMAPGHSASGIMRADWTREDMTQASRGILRFTADQAATLRRAATRRR